MTFELTQEQRWEILNSLPESLREAIFSGDTAEAIGSICSLHNCEDASTVGKIVGQVLMGLLPPQKVAEAIMRKLPMTPEATANTMSLEIQHYIFDPIMDDLSSLYTPEKVEKLNIEIKPTDKSDERDLYRESI